MQISQYIVLKRTGSQYSHRFSTRLTKNNPSLQSNEIAIKLSIELPNEIFDKPLLQAKVTIPNSVVSKPVIDATVIDNVEQIIKQNTGFEVKLELIDATTPSEAE